MGGLHQIYKGILSKTNIFSDHGNDFQAALNFEIEVILTKLKHDGKQTAETSLAYDLAYFGDDIKQALIKIERSLQFDIVLENLIVYRLIKFQYQTSKKLIHKLSSQLNAPWQENQEDSDDTETPIPPNPEYLMP